MPDWKSFSSAVPEILAIGLRRRRLVPNAAASAGRRRRAMGAGNCARRANLTSLLDIFSPHSETGIGRPGMDTEARARPRTASRSADFQVCCVAGFQTRWPSGHRTRSRQPTRHSLRRPCRFGNRRNSRFGNLRYGRGGRDAPRCARAGSKLKRCPPGAL